MHLTIDEILQAIDGEIIGGKSDNAITSITTNSREATAGALFIPIKGENFDGHHYIPGAIANGAVCALTEVDAAATTIPLIKVNSTRKALMDIAHYYRCKHDIKVVAITGSAGKTTTKDMIYHVLARKYKTKKTMGNFNNDIGLPLSIFQLAPEDEALVLEMGMNHANEIHELSKVGAPDIAVITHIGDAHIENFENREGILHAKLEIVDGLAKTGTVILNGNDPLLTGPIAQAKTAGFEVLYPADENIIAVKADGLANSHVKYHWQGHDIDLTVPIPGGHMVMNALLAVAVGIKMGISPTEISKGFDDFIPPAGRLSVEAVAGMTIINDAYNANPAAMVESIKIVAAQTNRKVLILGDMNELGQVAQARHTEIGEYAKNAGIDQLIAIGPNARYIYDGFANPAHSHYFEKVADFIPHWQGHLQPNDLVLVKASRGMEFEKIINAIK